MKITKKKIKELNPHRSIWEWYINKSSESKDLETLLLEINEKDPSWAVWLFIYLMNKKQCVEIAIFAAESVIVDFEEKYPDEKSPRNVIEAAKAWLEDPSEENRKAAYATYTDVTNAVKIYDDYFDAIVATSYVATTTYFDTYGDAHFDSEHARGAICYATHAAYTNHNDVKRKELRIEIIKEAVKILDRDEI